MERIELQHFAEGEWRLLVNGHNKGVFSRLNALRFALDAIHSAEQTHKARKGA